MSGAVIGGVGAWDLLALAGAAALALVYAVGLHRLWQRAGYGVGVPHWAAGAAAAGWLALVAALGPPLAGLSDLLFAAHMGQHELLMLVAAPLVVLSQPLVVIVGALPRGARRALAAVVRRRRVRRAWRLLTAPVGALVLQAVVLWGWHLPWAFEAALANDALHAVQHLSFFAVAALFWWSLVHGRFGRMGYGAGVLVVFATALHSGLLGALLTFAPSPWYPTHAARASAREVAPLADQQLAGLLMWIPSGFLLAVAGLALFAAWLGEVARRDQRAGRARAAAAAARRRPSSG
ncbi:MAG TPA: cytochrome c oxidase assembly protein [Thermoanaerobaculia bacterium]|nr:cytochrome c oxidase assembly protein [Thermoanaerobaculia bacterium]